MYINLHVYTRIHIYEPAHENYCPKHICTAYPHAQDQNVFPNPEDSPFQKTHADIWSKSYQILFDIKNMHIDKHAVALPLHLLVFATYLNTYLLTDLSVYLFADLFAFSVHFQTTSNIIRHARLSLCNTLEYLTIWMFSILGGVFAMDGLILPHPCPLPACSLVLYVLLY